MANNSMGTKKVEELLVSKSMPLGMQFYVPNYQRGYRWKESQVQQLLNDIKEFDYEKNNEKKFYCLQPLVVTEDKENGWVVIDGQQRLTTLFIILTCIEKMLYKEKAQLYQMNYQNKPQMHDWLEELGDVNNDVQINSDDIDAYHITNACIQFNIDAVTKIIFTKIEKIKINDIAILIIVRQFFKEIFIIFTLENLMNRVKGNIFSSWEVLDCMVGMRSIIHTHCIVCSKNSQMLL